MGEKNLLRLLIIDESMNDAEMLVSTLRNAGNAVRPASASDESELNNVLKEQQLDMIICSLDVEEPTLQQVYQAVTQSKQDISILAIADEPDSEKQLLAMQSGARDLVGKKNMEHLQLVVKREMDDLVARRKLAEFDSSSHESEKRFRSLLDSSRDAISYVHEGMHIYANPAYLEMFGFPDAEEIESTPVMDIVNSDNHAKLKDFLRRYSKGEQNTMELEIQALRPGGESFDAVMEFSPASIEGETCTQIMIRDQSINKELEKKIKYLSKQDLLTGLYNRQYFLEELNLAVADAKHNKKTYSVFYIEPDNFKALKEKVGIAGTDLILGDIASMLRDNLEGSDIASRFGDNSFTTLTRINDINVVMALANKIRGAIESHISEIGGKTVTIVCSIGITLFDETVQDTQEVISNADLACELARKKGGNCVHLHNPIADKMAAQAREKESTAMIKSALAENRFFLVYQPIASLHGEAGEKYEVLMRVQDKEGNEVLPSQFISVAEDTGLIVEIDRWVIAKAMEILAERRRNGNDTVFFVKLSAKSIGDENLLPWIIKHLKKNRLEGNGIVFEVYEAAVVNQLKVAQAFLKGLMELHCGFGLEHFGTGTNSIQLLKHLPANYLKVDGSFMRNLASNKENQAIIKSISEMASSRHMTTIAEFVEDASSLAILWQCGVNFIQGHFLQKPDEMMNYDFEGEEQQNA